MLIWGKIDFWSEGLGNRVAKLIELENYIQNSLCKIIFFNINIVLICLVDLRGKSIKFHKIMGKRPACGMNPTTFLVPYHTSSENFPSSFDSIDTFCLVIFFFSICDSSNDIVASGPGDPFLSLEVKFCATSHHISRITNNRSYA